MNTLHFKLLMGLLNDKFNNGEELNNDEKEFIDKYITRKTEKRKFIETLNKSDHELTANIKKYYNQEMNDIIFFKMYEAEELNNEEQDYLKNIGRAIFDFNSIDYKKMTKTEIKKINKLLKKHNIQ